MRLKPGIVAALLSCLPALAATPDPAQVSRMARCSKIANEACAKKFASQSSGNFEFPFQGGKLKVQDGPEPVTRIPWRDWYFMDAAVKARKKMPRDFLDDASSEQFFELAERWVTSPWPTASRDKLLLALKRGLENVEVQRFRKAGGKRPPSEIRRELWGQVFSPMWSDHPRWLVAQKQFAIAQKGLVDFLAGEPGLPPALRDAWIQRVRTVRLVPAYQQRELRLECLVDDVNAMYSVLDHTISVCSGFFTTREGLLALFHELSHSLGTGRSLWESLRASPLARKLEAVRHDLCQGPPNGCSSHWAELRATFEKDVEALSAYRHEVPRLKSCLMTQPEQLRSIPPDLDVSEPVNAAYRGMAAAHGFSQLADRLESADRAREPLPFCAAPTDLMNIGLTGALFFSAEYRCLGDLPDARRLDKSIALSRKLATSITERMFRAQGRYAITDWMQSQHYSENIEERFADTIGGRAFGKYLLSLPSLADRRNLFIAETILHCPKPDDEDDSDVSQVENRYALESHSDSYSRRKELLVPEIRAALACVGDSPKPDCGW